MIQSQNQASNYQLICFIDSGAYSGSGLTLPKAILYVWAPNISAVKRRAGIDFCLCVISVYCFVNKTIQMTTF